MDNYTLIALVAAVALALADLIITSRNLRGGGTEDNLPMRFMIGEFGMWPGGLMLKTITMGLAALVSVLLLGTLFYGLVGHAISSLIGFIISYARRSRNPRG